MKRLLLVLFAAVGLSGCIVHPIGLRPPLPPGGHPHHNHHPKHVVVNVGVR
ncbi:MAG TPA: lipoprotein [Myxococcales bacterium]|jgi:hypothetical protein